ncbi:hypothetical protein ACQ4LE_004123 [Meloidogyne hapla]
MNFLLKLIVLIFVCQFISVFGVITTFENGVNDLKIFLREITDSKKVEKEIEDYTKKLENEELEINKKSEELEKGKLEKENFFLQQNHLEKKIYFKNKIKKSLKAKESIKNKIFKLENIEKIKEKIIKELPEGKYVNTNILNEFYLNFEDDLKKIKRIIVLYEQCKNYENNKEYQNCIGYEIFCDEFVPLMEGEIFKELEINVENENAEGEKPNLNFLINTYTDYAYTINDILKDYENIKNEKFIQEIKKVFPERCINSSLLEKVDLSYYETLSKLKKSIETYETCLANTRKFLNRNKTICKDVEENAKKIFELFGLEYKEKEPMVEKPKKSMVEKATDYIFNIFTRTQNKEENIGQASTSKKRPRTDKHGDEGSD